MRDASIVCAVVAAALMGCTPAQKLEPPPVPPPSHVQASAPQMQFDFTQNYRPVAGYVEPFGSDDLANRMRYTDPDAFVRQRVAAHRAALRYRPARRYPWLNTLFWSGVGAVVGHQKHRAWEGAGLGAIFGHTLARPGGMDPGRGGLITPSTLLLGGAGAVIGHQRHRTCEGAALGAVLGRLIDAYRIRRRWHDPYW